jgi:hypothetical protein
VALALFFFVDGGKETQVSLNKTHDKLVSNVSFISPRIATSILLLSLSVSRVGNIDTSNPLITQ